MVYTIAEGNRCKDSSRKTTMPRMLTTSYNSVTCYNTPGTSKYLKKKKKIKCHTYLHVDTPPTCLVYYWTLLVSLYYFDQLYTFACIAFHVTKFILVFYGISKSIDYLFLSYHRLSQPVLDPQMGFMKMDPYLKESIQVWCLFESLRGSKNKTAMVAAITQYLQAHVSESLPLYVYRQFMKVDYVTDWSSKDGHDRIEDMIEEAFSYKLMEDDEDMMLLDPQDGEEVPWFEAMDNAFGNWREFRTSNVAKKVTHLINVVVSAGMCSTASLEFKLGNVALFSPIVSKKQLAAVDIFDAFYEAVSGFMKGGWRVYKTGEVSSFFMEDDKITEFDNMYNNIRSWHGYALTGNLLEYTKIDDNEYDDHLKKAIEFGDNLVKSIPRSQTFERKYVSDRMNKLRDNETEFTQLRTRGGLRVSPFAVCLFGQSGCGKSSLTNLTVNAGLVYNKLSAAKDRIATWADNDKFASSVRSHINAIIFDDFANTKEDFMDFSPAYRLIQVINNIRYLAPMADVFLKGKVTLNPYFCVVSTNVEHLNAAKYSNEPESLLRRLYHVKVEPKASCCKDGVLNKKKIEKLFGKTASPDAWYLTVRCYEAQNLRYVDLSQMKTIVFEGKPLERVSVFQYLKWLQITSKKHFEEERDFIANQDEIPDPCDECGLLYCNCQDGKNMKLPEDDDELTLEPHSGEWEYYSGNALGFFHRQAEKLQAGIERSTTASVLAMDSLCRKWEQVDFMPERWICHPTILKFGLFFWKDDMRQSLIAGNSLFAFMLVPTLLAFPRLSLLWVILTIFLMYWYTCATVQTYTHMVRNRILEIKDVVKTHTQQWQFTYAIIGLGAIGLVLAAMRSKYSKLEPQTGLDPENIEEVQKRNDQVNPWLKSEVKDLPMSEPAKTTTCDNLALSMKTNLIGIVSDIGKCTLGFYITSNFLIVPTHFVDIHGDRDIPIRCYKNDEGKVGSYFRDKISRSFTVNIPKTDFSVSYVTSGGSMKNFRKFLPESDIIGQVPAKVVTRSVTGSKLELLPTLFRGSSMVRHKLLSFVGSYYVLSVETKSGMCMSPVISDSKGSTILGFHLGGKSKIGGCGIITLEQVDTAISKLSSVDGVVLSASCGELKPHMGDFPDRSYGFEIRTGVDIHQKSATNYLTEGACIDVYGSTTGKATPHSNVTSTIISDSVTRVFGVPQKWGPPKMKGPGRYPYQATLVHAAVPSLPIGSVLSTSVKSMKNLTVNLKNKISELFDIAPLSRVATVSGLKGVKFIDAMNFNSSPGFPLSGSKHPLLIDLDEKDHPEVGKPRTFKPEIWEEFDETVKTLVSGKRCYAIWKSCLKDEPTKLSKDKVRVFQSAPLVLQLIIRMYFLPIVRIIQMNPILYECAVGVNAEGLEWEQLWQAAMSKGKDRVLAGDYSKYDVRMPAQVTIAAFDILIDIASKCKGYTAENLHLMRMVVNEVVYPVMAYNGDLIQLFGTNPSGQNLTVIINSLVNSLLLRSCFFTIYPSEDFKFNCSFLTYGDDVIGTVSAKCDKFTHITYADWLQEHDMKFTMPDKESTPVHYMSESDVDFLKRKCVFNNDLGQQVGLLSEDSIFKRLHSHILSKELTLPMHAAQNIESSLHDWFYYGREVFEDRKQKLQEVAKDCGIEHLCPALNASYDKRVNHWKHKYLGEELEEDEDEVELEVQCGDLYVSTVDYNDHCIGTTKDIFYNWEHWLTNIYSPFQYFIWYLVLVKGYRFKFGMIRREWLILLVLLTRGGASFLYTGILMLCTICYAYYPLLLKWFVVNFIVDDNTRAVWAHYFPTSSC